MVLPIKSYLAAKHVLKGWRAQGCVRLVDFWHVQQVCEQKEPKLHAFGDATVATLIPFDSGTEP